MKNTFNSIRRFGKSMREITLEGAFNICPAFLHISSTWILKFKLLPILMPQSF